MRLIDADNLTKNLTYDIANHPIHGNFKITVASVRAAISNAPAIDAVPDKLLPSLKEGKRVTLDEIIGGGE